MLLWDKASTVTFYRGSHHLDIPGPGASNGLWEVPAAKLDLGKAEWFAFEHGGLYVNNDLVRLSLANLVEPFKTPELFSR